MYICACIIGGGGGAGGFVVGLAVGIASMAVPLYIAELAPSSMRGTLVASNVVFITFGQFVSCVIAASLSKFEYPHGWQLMLALAGVPAVVQFVGLLGAPESPRWLAKYKSREAALRVLLKLRSSSSEANEELEEIMASLEEEAELNSEDFSVWEFWNTPGLRRALILGCMLQTVAQLSGINTVMYYAGTIIQMVRTQQHVATTNYANRK